MSAPDYYSMPQAQGEYQSAFSGQKKLVKGRSIHDKIAQKKQECALAQKHMYVMGIEVVAFAYIVCLYVILEGILIMFKDPAHYLDVIRGPFAQTEVFILTAVGYGDIVGGIIGFCGLFLGTNLLQGWRRLAPMHSFLATTFTIAIIAWRCLVCLVFAPWVGILLAFAFPAHSRLYPCIVALGYIMLSISMLYILIMAFKEIRHDTRQFQLHLNEQRLHERKFLLKIAAKARLEGNGQDGEAMHDHEIEPHVFGFLPLTETVTIYAVLIAVATLLSFVHISFSGQTAGGWAFFAGTRTVVQTYTLELILYPICFVCAVFGVLGTSTFGGFGFLKEGTALNAILLFLISSAIRFCLLFSVTGMALIERNECGVYINGVARMSRAPMNPLVGASRNNVLLHCTTTSFFVFALTFVFMLLDGYMTWATFQLHHHASDWIVSGHELNGQEEEESAMDRWIEGEGLMLSGADREAAGDSCFYGSSAY
jgi:hypothetical protein